MKKIICVDDSATERNVLSGYLRDVYDVETVESGAALVVTLRGRAFAISAIVLDLMMPGMDGFEVLRFLRGNAIYRQIPVIVATGADDVDTQVRVMSLGANGYVCKPFNRDLLIYTLENAINLREKAALANEFRMDRLTGLYNRSRFHEVALALIKRKPAGFYMLSCIDVENFKTINEQYGTKAGDALLKHIGEIISDCATKLDGASCRDSADKFLLLYSASDKDSDLVAKLHDDIRKSAHESRSIRIRVGRYLIDDLEIPVSSMCDRATLAEESVKNRYDVYIADYDDSMRIRLLNEQQIVTEMDDALANGEFEPWLQPQYNHQTGALIGAEALVRWRRNGQYVSPAEFVPVFERNGFIYEMDCNIWEQVCRLLRRWLNEGLSPLPVSVNISRRDMLHQRFVEKLVALVDRYRVPYQLLRLEVTESAFSESTRLITAKVEELIRLGFTVEIDDFGSGYSSLNTLKDVPASILKLDMRFFENTENSQRGGNIVESVVRMAKWLGMAVIAEGVEEKAQADYLKSIGCYYIQGYYYARPMPVEDYERLFERAERESELSRLKTLKTLDNNDFWDPKSMDTLIFNSYVGAACILEYTGGRVEMLRATDYFVRMLGTDCMTIKELLELDWTAHMADESLARLGAAIKESAQSKEPSADVYEFTDLPGCPRKTFLRVGVRAIAVTGERYLVYCINDNITAQREAEERQQEAEKRQLESAQQLESIMGNINGGVSAITVDDHGAAHFVFNNEKYYGLYGYTRAQAEAEKLDVMKLILPEDFPIVMEKIQKLKADGQPLLIDYGITKRDGRRALLRANASRMSMEGYEDEVISSVITDITELRSLETQLRTIVDNINGGVTATVIRDGKPEFVVVNDRFYHMLGFATGEEYEAACSDKYSYIHPEDRERIVRQFETQDGGKVNYSMEYRVVRRDGAVRYMRNNISVVRMFGYDEPVQLSVVNDVTDQVEAEARQIELLDNLPSGAALYAFDGERLSVIHINRQYWRLVEREPSGYDKDSVMDVIHPDDLSPVRQELAAAIRQRRNIAVDIRILTGGGAYKPFHVTATVTVGNNGEYLLYTTYYPISDAAISLQETLPIALSTMMATSEDISYIKGKDLHYICCSQALADMTGYRSARDLIGKNAYDLFERKAAQKFTEDDQRILDTGKPVIDAIEHLPMADGGIRLARTSKFPLRDATGDIIGVYCISHDVSAQRQRDSQLELLSKSIPGGIASYLFTKEGVKTLYFNEGYYDYSGYTREEYLALTQKEPLALMFEEDRPRLLEMVRAMRAERRDGMTGACDYRCHAKDGGTRWMSLKTVLTQLDEEQFILNAVQLDMTEHVEVERRMENLLDNLPFGAAMYLFDGKELTALHINQQYTLMVNRNVDSTLEGFRPEDFIHPDDRKLVMDEIADAIAHRRDGFCDIRLLYGEGEYRTFHLDARITPQGNGSYLLYVAYTRISEQTLTLKNSLPFIFSTIMESSTDLAFAKDVNFRYLCCSKTFAALLGLASEQDVVGKTDYELFPTAIADRFRRDDSMLFATQKPQIDVVEAIPASDGTKRYTRTSKHLLRDTVGNVIGVYCVGRDVTKAKEALARLELLTNSIPGGIATFRCMPGKIETVYFNDGICALAGYDREEYTRRRIPVLDFVFDEDRPVVRKQLELLQSGETRLDFLLRIHTNGGGYKWLSGQASVTDREEDGAFIVSAVLTDITAEQEEKERRRIAEEEYRIATKHSGHTIGRYNIATRQLTISEEAASRLGLPETIPDVPYGRVRLGKISKNTANAYIEFYEKLMAGEKECSVTFQKLLPKGWRWITERATTLFDNGGKPVTAIVSFLDVTELQEKEAVYEKWRQNLHEKGPDTFTLYICNLNRDASYDSVEGKLLNFHESWDDAHTFNEHTADFAQHCVCEEDRAQYQKFVDSDAMLASYYRGRRFAELEFRGVIATGDLHWLRLTVELVEYANTSDVAAYMMYEDINEAKLQELHTQTLAETDPLTGLLNRKTFIELITQKLEQQREGTLYGLLLLDLDGFKLINDSYGHSVGDQVLIDIGKAIQSVLRRYDFVCRMGGDEFLVCLAAMPGRDAILKKAQQICERVHKDFNLDVRMSVSIGIAVSPDDGDSFQTLYLKADKALYRVKENGKDNCVFYEEGMSLTPAPSELDRNRKPAKVALVKTRPKLLVVDDNKINRKLLKNMFIDDFDVETADDGLSALQAIRKQASELAVILLDLGMPDMDGFAVLERLRENEETASIPVVVISGMDERDATLRVLQAGASDFVTKPVDPMLLRIRVESAISKAENERLRAQNRYLTLVKATP